MEAGNAASLHTRGRPPSYFYFFFFKESAPPRDLPPSPTRPSPDPPPETPAQVTPARSPGPLLAAAQARGAKPHPGAVEDVARRDGAAAGVVTPRWSFAPRA